MDTVAAGPCTLRYDTTLWRGLFFNRQWFLAKVVKRLLFMEIARIVTYISGWLKSPI